MDIYWCPVCKQLRRFEIYLHISKNVTCGICTECKNHWEGKELEELYERGSMVD